MPFGVFQETYRNKNIFFHRKFLISIEKIFDLGLVCSQQLLTFEEMAERDLNKT